MSRPLRVIAGEARSLHLQVPVRPGIRPTTDAMRATLFSSLGAEVRGARFADLYAGSGAVGIEALSRGAQQAVFVESDRRCVEVIRNNLKNTKLISGGVVLQRKLPAAWGEIAARYGPFDIVFADPPYDSDDLVRIAEKLVGEREGLAAQAIVVLQHAQPGPPPSNHSTSSWP